MILILISDFMQDEIYLEEETKYYEGFEKVIFFSVKGHVYSNKALRLNEKIICGEKDIFYKNNIDRFKTLCKAICSHKGILELKKIVKDRKLSFFTIKSYGLFSAKAELLYDHMKAALEKMHISKEEKIVFYSYRFGIGVLAAQKLRTIYKRSKIVARCHGQDLFEFRNGYGYLPYRYELYKNVDKLFCISKDGQNYIKEKYPQILYKTDVCRLGTKNVKYNKNISNKKFTIITCSRVVPLKRLHLLAEALRFFSEKITWIHYGDGDASYGEKIQKSCSALPDNIQVIFKGFVDNEELRKEYENISASIFVNLSTSEGLPVSIMEACSVGFPVLATNVGGTSEIVSNGINGYLLNEKFTIEELVSKLNKLMKMDEMDFIHMSEMSRKIWETSFSSIANYKIFATKLLEI